MKECRRRHLAVAALAVMLALPASPAAARDVEKLEGGGARPSCTFVGLAGDLDVDGGGTNWYGGLNLPDPAQGNEWQPVAEGPLVGVKDTLTGTWEVTKEPFGTAQVTLTIGKKIGHDTETDESGTIRITYYAMTGTVTVAGVTYPITGCQYKEYRHSADVLPHTGSHTGPLAGAGAWLLTAGALLVAVARRRRIAASTTA
jgi:LPXTG-motif cell wall-anchored protein